MPAFLPTSLFSARRRRAALSLIGVLLAGVLAGCGGGGDGGGTDTSSAKLSEAAQLGELIFHDTRLSASGRMSCASCHDPARGHASPFATPVAFGGPGLDQAGTRNPPSLRYLRFNTAFGFDDEGTPNGGFFWDGRAATLKAQAREPLLNPVEMANPDAASVVAKLAEAPYAERFRALFGQDILQRPDDAFDRLAFALQRYQEEDPAFAPFTSKFDAFTAGRASFTPQELKGMALFNRTDKGNCAACHSSARPANAPGALFTDFSYDNLGVPRNPLIPANADPASFDGGLCGASRPDLAARSDLCGAFKVPSLRNVALRTHFFHNGVFTSLEDVIRFYVTRDVTPERWYASAAYDDMPPALRGNVNTSEGPYNRTPAQGAALTESEIADLAAFLRTLTDGYIP